jgi:nitrite reductase/ring-hydroxylating ferredoxin subunit
MYDVATSAKKALRRIERTKALDQAADVLAPFVRRLTRPDRVKNALSGTTIGHRLHPALTDIPIGAWVSASLLDVIGGRGARTGARRLVGIGVVTAIPAALTGLSDWEDADKETRRIGIVHLAANSAGILLQLTSWSARGKGHFFRAKVLSAGGLGAVTVGGFLGGHMAFTRRAGVDAEVPVLESYGWQTACEVSELADGKPVGAVIDGVQIAIVRDAGRTYAMAARCTHAGGPLQDGTLTGGCIECPWHGSRFDLATGKVRRGPATADETTYETRVRDTSVEVRRRPPVKQPLVVPRDTAPVMG